MCDQCSAAISLEAEESELDAGMWLAIGWADGADSPFHACSRRCAIALLEDDGAFAAMSAAVLAGDTGEEEEVE